MGVLTLKDLTISYGQEPVVRDFSLQVEDGELVSILGPSGSGKTTILRAVAGLIEPVSGDITLDNKSLMGTPPEERDTVMVFQKPLLFPFMNVRQNVGFGLSRRGRLSAENKKQVEEILELVGLPAMGRRKPHELSGGQQQRVALARALVLRPRVLLLDEPLAALDANLRDRMRELIREIQKQTGVTTLFVTHDQAEAVMLSHRIALILAGRLRQAGPPRELFRRPADVEVARFFGGANFLPGEVKGGAIRTAIGELALEKGGPADGGEAVAFIRPEDLVVKTEGGVRGVIRKTRYEGQALRLWIEVNGVELIALAPDRGAAAGEEVTIEIRPERVWLLPEGEDED